VSIAPPRGPAAPPRPPPRPMDPRIRQRRIAVARHQGRQRLRILVGFVAVFGTAALTALVLHSPWLSVSAVRVDGVSPARARAVSSALASIAHRPLIDVDPAATAALALRLPWVDTVTVRRSWPSTVTIDVTARTPVAQLENAALHWAEVDASGRVLDISVAPVPGLVDLGGMPAAGAPGSSLPRQAIGSLSVIAALPSPLRAQVVAVGPTPAGGVSMTLGSGAVVDLGPPVDVAAKMTALSTVLASVDMTGVQTIDLRVPDQPALTRR